MARDRDETGRARSARPRDAYGRPFPHDAEGEERVPDDYAAPPAEDLPPPTPKRSDAKPLP